MLSLSHDPARTFESIAQFSKKDAATYPAWERWLEGIADTVWPLFTEVPPNLGSLHPRDLLAAGRVAWRARRLGLRGVADLTRLSAATSLCLAGAGATQALAATTAARLMAGDPVTEAQQAR